MVDVAGWLELFLVRAPSYKPSQLRGAIHERFGLCRDISMMKTLFCNLTLSTLLQTTCLTTALQFLPNSLIWLHNCRYAKLQVQHETFLPIYSRADAKFVSETVRLRSWSWLFMWYFGLSM